MWVADEIYSPVFIKKPEDIFGDSGQEVILECMAESNAPPSYRLRNNDSSQVWYFLIIS